MAGRGPAFHLFLALVAGIVLCESILAKNTLPGERTVVVGRSWGSVGGCLGKKSKAGAQCWALRPLPAKGAEQRIRALVWQCMVALNVERDRSDEEGRNPWDGSAEEGRP